MLISAFVPSNVSYDENEVTIEFQKDQVSKFHNIWLRDSCQCEEDFHPQTKQRLLDTFTIREDIQPVEAAFTSNGTQLEIKWNDGHVSNFDLEWLVLHSYNPTIVENKSAELKKKLWDTEYIKANWPEVKYSDVMDSEEGVKEWANKIYSNGFSMVEGVPVSPEATEKLIERLSYIKPTHYGGFWDFTADLSKNDTAYTNLTIASHTDGTYWSDTPGLQLFHMLHHDGTGGENMLVDGFKCAEKLKAQSPEAYKVLSTVRVPAHSAGEEDVCITPAIAMPVFTHNPQTGELIQVRWNNCDRSIMDQWTDPSQVLEFYKAARLWHKLLTDPANEIQIQLKPGQCLIFDNWRVLHGRIGFTGNRRMCGAYVNRDDFVSRAKLLNLGRDVVIRHL